MEMNSLKTRPSKETGCCLGPRDTEHYPTIHLSTQEVEALQVENLKVGDERILLFRARVSSVGRTEYKEEDPTHYLTFELIEGNVSTAKKSQAERLYGKE